MAGMNIFAAAALCVTAFLGAATQTPADIVIPQDPSTVIVSMDSHDYWGDLSGANSNPLLAIRADGTIYGSGVLQGRLTQPEVQNLLRYLIEEQGFFNLNATDIRRAIDTVESKTGIRVDISDAAERTVRIRTADKDHEVRFYASSFYATRYPPTLYPELKSLGQLRAVETKLSQIVETLKAGGDKVVLDILAEGNAYLARGYPQVAPFTVRDFLKTISADGQSKRLSFFRSDTAGVFASLDVTYRQGETTLFRFSEEKLPPELFGPVLP